VREGPQQASDAWAGVGEHPLHARLIGYDLVSGGAARATLRIADALHENAGGLGLKVSVRVAKGPDWSTGEDARLPAGAARVRRVLSYWKSAMRTRVSAPTRGALRSRADIWTGLAAETNRLRPDVVNFHWIGDGTISVEELARVRAPKVLTLGDMWYFCGAEHLAHDRRYIDGYTADNRDPASRGVDWDRWTWERKARHWVRPMHVVAKSTWVAERCSESALMGDWPIRVIPNPIDPDLWFPVGRSRARTELGLPQNAAIVLFGAVGGSGQKTKGGDLLGEALSHIPLSVGSGDEARELLLVTFGGRPGRTQPNGRSPVPVHDLGPITDDERLRTVYAAADVMVVPSRIDILPNTALEAQACGTPVVAFDVAGLRDIVIDAVTGRLVEPFDPRALAEGIVWCLEASRNQSLAREARTATARFDPGVIARAYAEVFLAARAGG
jgi:glycosyltransferase involved in cell wall biosynthesis